MDEPTPSKPETEATAKPEPEEAAPETPEAEQQDAAETPESAWSAGAEAERIAELEAENADVKDRLLRLAADMENLRRRTEKDVRDASQYAIAKFARDVVSVGDNLQRALDSVPAEDRDAAEAGLKALLEGVDMTARDLDNMLGRHGITRIDPKGEKFDPNSHEAVFQVPDETVPAGTVAQVMQPGYTIGDRVLRPAMVGVSVGGPKEAPASDSAGEAAPEAEGAATPQDDTAPPGSTVDKTA